MSFKDRFRQAEELKLLNRLKERENRIREMLEELELQEEEELRRKEELELQEEEELEDGLLEPISQLRTEQRRRIYDDLEHIQDAESRLLELRRKRAILKQPEHVEAEEYKVSWYIRLQEEIQRKQAEESRLQQEIQSRQAEERRLQEQLQRRQAEERRQEELRRENSEYRKACERLQEERRQEELRRENSEYRKEEERLQEERRRQNWSFEVSREYDRMYGERTPQELREMEESLQREREWRERFG